MIKIKVNLNERSYPIVIGRGAVEKLLETVNSIHDIKCVVVITDKRVEKKTAHIVRPILEKLSKVVTISVPASEKSKSLIVFQNTIQKICRATKKHRPLIVALGGGVVGDLAGFVAATYRRGVPLVQIPTTLLAQVDSSIGGKVGIDLAEAKNLVGAFYQPQAVLMEPAFLKSLPIRQVRSGIAEIIKYGIIAGGTLFDFLENKIEDVLSLEERALERVIYECARVKAKIVEKDELDQKDVRIVLNFGHTLAHAIESAAGYSAYNHGEAVAVGMVLASEIARGLEMLKEKEFDRIKSLIKRAGLPVCVKRVCMGGIINSYGYDKKFTSGSNRFVLPRRIGSVEVVDDIPSLLIKTVLRKYVS
ncbi:MAG: 3-dehydroquinate synthase [Candidatus Omnitrophota bacterium]